MNQGVTDRSNSKLLSNVANSSKKAKTQQSSPSLRGLVPTTAKPQCPTYSSAWKCPFPKVTVASFSRKATISSARSPDSSELPISFAHGKPTAVYVHCLPDFDRES